MRGYEATNMIRIGQINGVEKGDIRAQAEFVSQIGSGVADLWLERLISSQARYLRKGNNKSRTLPNFFGYFRKRSSLF